MARRFPFLDWMRGLALVIMIQCHVFNSFTRMDARKNGVYALSQFIGGMAGPLFLFMAGMTFAFLMDREEQRGSPPMRRWLAGLRRAVYILAIAHLIRFVDWIGAWPLASWTEILRVDILNSMGLALAFFSAAALLEGGRRIRTVFWVAVAIAAASPLVANLDWSGVPSLLREYLMPGYERGHFPFFPCATYAGFGIVAGAAVRLTDASRMDRTMQWAALIGGTAVLAAQYASNLPYAVYPKSNFWTDSPALVIVRTGLMLLALAASHTWTAYGASLRWSWTQSLGRNSLLVYWVHLVLVYGAVSKPLQQALPVSSSMVASFVVIVLMVAMTATWQWGQSRLAFRRAAAPLLSNGFSQTGGPQE